MSIGLLSYWDPKLTTVLHSQQCLFSVWRTPFEYLVTVKSPRPNSLSLVWLFFLPHFDVVAATIFFPFAVAAAALNGCYVTQVRPGQQYHQRYKLRHHHHRHHYDYDNGHYQPKYNSKWNFTHSLLINRLISLSPLCTSQSIAQSALAELDSWVFGFEYVLEWSCNVCRSCWLTSKSKIFVCCY